jgi:hypothetical protein
LESHKIWKANNTYTSKDTHKNQQETTMTMSMTKEDIEKKIMTKEGSEKTKITMTKEGSEKTKTQEGKKPTGTKPKAVAEKQQQQPVCKTDIAARLYNALKFGGDAKAEQPLIRSSELVPLSQDFDQMRKQLRSLIAAAKQYHAARVHVEKARMEVRTL